MYLHKLDHLRLKFHMTDQSTLKEEQLNEKVTNEEYKLWKKHSPFLYDTCLVSSLQWPSLSVQWFPTSTEQGTNTFLSSNLLLSTAAPVEETNYLFKALVDLPQGDGDGSDLHNFVEKGQTILHQGPVRQSRVSPRNGNLVASISAFEGGETQIYDLSDFPTSMPSEAEAPKPTATLEADAKEGRGLAMHPTDENLLLTCTDTGVTLWNWKVHERQKTCGGNFSEVQWRDAQTFGAIAETGVVSIWDIREPKKSAFSFEAHQHPSNTLAFSPLDPNFIATGADDSTVRVWDLRGSAEPIRELRGHSQQVRVIRWSPHDRFLVASGGNDRRIKIWDITLAHEDEDPEGPPELVFIHGGHVSRITDLDWHPTIPWTIASTSEDNIVQVWSPASAIVNKL